MYIVEKLLGPHPRDYPAKSSFACSRAVVSPCGLTSDASKNLIVHIYIEILPQDKLQPGLNENLPPRSVTSNKENEVGNTICIIIHINI